MKVRMNMATVPVSSIAMKSMLVLLFFSLAASVTAQVNPVDSLGLDSIRKGLIKPVNETFEGQYDVGNLFRDIFHKDNRKDSVDKQSGITVIPNIAANPTIGSQIGIKAVAGIKIGKDPSTIMSVAATSASITTKGIILFYLNHNLFTNGNKWNLQGNIVAARNVIPDYGLGIGSGKPGSGDENVLSNAGRREYTINGLYFIFREKIYKEVFKNVFIGAGAAIDIKRNIEERNTTVNELTPYRIYTDRYGFDRTKYTSNGLLLSTQYTSRDNLNRAFKGVYADVSLRINQQWMGSTKNAMQFSADVRKYWSLSKRNPEHVVAFWNWGSYVMHGVLPYLELPGTGKDPSSRSGRGYTVSYFRGTQYYYSEAEYRFPITNNKFLSGVTFFHLQSANDMSGTKIFQHWQPGGGAGLRILFNKSTRTNLALDYAFGKYGAKGFFLGLNEAF